MTEETGNAATATEWQGMAPERQEVIRNGAEAMRVHRQGLTRIFAIGQAFEAMQDEAMYRSHSNNPIGKRYNDAYALLEKPVPELARINKTDRSQFIWCWKRHEAIERWWITKAQNQKDRWNHPDAVKKNYRAENDDEEEGGKAGRRKQPSAVEKLKAENVRLREELDAANAKFRRLERDAGDALLITRKDTPEEILNVLENEIPAKVQRIAGLLLNRQKSTSPPKRRGRKKEAEAEGDDPAEPIAHVGPEPNGRDK
jgi:hypothetical protein